MIDVFTNGISHFYDTENEVIYYYSTAMREKNCVVKLDFFFASDEPEEVLTVGVLDGEEAQEFTLYWDKPLAPLIMRRMIKDIFAFQNYKDKKRFIEFLREMSIQHISSAQQHIEEHRLDIIRDVIADLALVEEFVRNNKSQPKGGE